MKTVWFERVSILVAVLAGAAVIGAAGKPWWAGSLTSIAVMAPVWVTAATTRGHGRHRTVRHPK